MLSFIGQCFFPTLIFLTIYLKVKSLSHVRPSATPWTAAFQAPPSMGFSRQEYWSGVPLPSPRPCLLSCKFNMPKLFSSSHLKAKKITKTHKLLFFSVNDIIIHPAIQGRKLGITWRITSKSFNESFPSKSLSVCILFSISLLAVVTDQGLNHILP